MSTYSSEGYSQDSYAKGRPTYNSKLVEYIVNYHLKQSGNKTCTVVDVATGTGIFARMLQGSFDKVIGTDNSASMLEVAKAHKDSSSGGEKTYSIEYVQASAEDLGFLKDGSVDVITVGTGAHWFEPQKFLNEVKRVLVPGHGTLAIFGYGGFGNFVDFPQCNALFKEFGMDVIGPYWDKGRRVLERLYSEYLHHVRRNGFKDIMFQIYPESAKYSVSTGYSVFDEPVVINYELSMESFHAYIRSWSAASNYNRAYADENVNISDVYYEKIFKASGVTDPKAKFRYEWDQALLICRF
ncbi:hypothetical protein BB560_004879 [Smittium megazygosporum]|uniref:Methyltransferase type 11 domain-containing protein n=1 Tax=Smittium megazygosporum TaxID=133381 RepID=A0A2T9Z821_9FUNG|nr:hypothetical protein BB560_004879 [Smittium megazygosporum]